MCFDGPKNDKTHSHLCLMDHYCFKAEQPFLHWQFHLITSLFALKKLVFAFHPLNFPLMDNENVIAVRGYFFPFDKPEPAFSKGFFLKKFE